MEKELAQSPLPVVSGRHLSSSYISSTKQLLAGPGGVVSSNLLISMYRARTDVNPGLS